MGQISPHEKNCVFWGPILQVGKIGIAIHHRNHPQAGDFWGSSGGWGCLRLHSCWIEHFGFQEMNPKAPENHQFKDEFPFGISANFANANLLLVWGNSYLPNQSSWMSEKTSPILSLQGTLDFWGLSLVVIPRVGPLGCKHLQLWRVNDYLVVSNLQSFGLHLLWEFTPM